MFSFKKKDKHEKKEKKAKKSGKEKLTDEELRRLEELHQQLQAEKKSSFSKKDKKHKGDQSISQSSSDYSVGSQTEKDGLPGTGYNNNDSDRDGFFSRKPSKDKKKSKGILKGTSSYGPPDLSRGTVSSKIDDHGILSTNTAYNERLVEPVVVPKYIPEIETTPPVLSPTDKTYNVDLQLPQVAPPKPKRARDVKLYRQPGGGSVSHYAGLYWRNVPSHPGSCKRGRCILRNPAQPPRRTLPDYSLGTG